jgi:putative endonuclease
MAYRQKVGQWGEQIAETYLIEQGCEILARNYRTAYGEADLIVRDGDCIVFVEVKTRTSRAYGTPEESITARKKEHILNTAEAYLSENPEINSDMRVDIISIESSSCPSDYEITWFKNALA